MERLVHTMILKKTRAGSTPLATWVKGAEQRACPCVPVMGCSRGKDTKMKKGIPRTLLAIMMSACLMLPPSFAVAQDSPASGASDVGASSPTSIEEESSSALEAAPATNESPALDSAPESANLSSPAASPSAPSASDSAGVASDAAPEGKPAASSAEPSDAASGDVAAAPDSAASAPAFVAAPEAAADAGRASMKLAAGNFLQKLSLTIQSGDVAKSYDLKSGQSVDATADFPDGIARDALYKGELIVDVKACAENAGAYPLVVGDTVTSPFPTLMGEGGSARGRMRDSATTWDAQHGGVGDYLIARGVLTISYDAGYLKECGGKVAFSKIEFEGAFNASSLPSDDTDVDLAFGNAIVKTRFSKLETVRNLSIEKTSIEVGKGPQVPGGQPEYPRQYSAYVDSDGCLYYSIKVTADKGNTDPLTHVRIVDNFSDESREKVDRSTMKFQFMSASNKRIRYESLTDESGALIGWELDSLAPGETVAITYSVKMNVDVVADAVRAAKEANGSSDALEERIIVNSASASADGVPEVTDTSRAVVENCIIATKTLGAYDSATQSQHFTVVVKAPYDNPFTEYNVPVSDVAQPPSGVRFTQAGVASATVRHLDGSTEPMELANMQTEGTNSWQAVIPQMLPGDEVSIDSYVSVPDEIWNVPAAPGVGGVRGMVNQVAAGSGINVGGVQAADLNRATAEASFDLLKNWLSKNEPSIGSDGVINWTIVGNQRGTSARPGNVAGQTVTDKLGPDQVFTGEPARVTFFNQDGSVAGSDTIALKEGDTSFSYVIPEQYGTCEFHIEYASKATDWEDYTGPAKAYTNSVQGLGEWNVDSQTVPRQAVPSLEKSLVEQSGDTARWQLRVFRGLNAGDELKDEIRDGANYMYFTQGQISGVTLAIGGAPVDPSLYEVIPGPQNSAGNFGMFSVKFKGQVVASSDGQTLSPSKETPLVVSYETTPVNPPKGGGRRYFNDAYLTVGERTDSDYDYCVRGNYDEMRKYVKETRIGIITWSLTVNEGGYSAQPDGTCLVTEVLPAGTEFVNVKKADGRGYVEVLDKAKNEDGTTSVTLKLSGLPVEELCKAHPSRKVTKTGLRMEVSARITDEGYLFGTEPQYFTFTNRAYLTDRFGVQKEGSSDANLRYTAVQKKMVYNEETAPNAEFTLIVNPGNADLSSSGGTVTLVDVSSDNLLVDPDSFEAEGITGLTLPLDVDVSELAQHKIRLTVQDGLYTKITYRARVLGDVGSSASVENSAFFDGHESHGSGGTVSETVQVLRARGTSGTDPGAEQPGGGDPDPDPGTGGEDPDPGTGGENPDPDPGTGGEDPDPGTGGEDPDPDPGTGGEDPDPGTGGEDPDPGSGGENPDPDPDPGSGTEGGGGDPIPDPDPGNGGNTPDPNPGGETPPSGENPGGKTPGTPQNGGEAPSKPADQGQRHTEKLAKTGDATAVLAYAFAGVALIAAGAVVIAIRASRRMQK